jgi:hypothetical protein
LSDSLQIALVILSYIADVAIILYAAYWAFAIRRATAGRIYRNQALWLGVLSVIVLTSFVPTPATNGAIVIVLINLPVIILALVAFAFVDATVPVARRSDPLLRDILHWGKLRVLGWGALILAEIFGAYGQIATNNTGSSVVIGLLLLLVIGAPPMLIGAKRSMDPILKQSLKWFALSLLTLIGLPLVTLAEVTVNLPAAEFLNYSQIPYNMVTLLFGYAFYRSARSLAPISRLQTDETETGFPSVVRKSSLEQGRAPS